jgi:uncharacterized protein YehS (DUF1456 family)
VIANDILRKIRYALDLKDREMVEIFHGGQAEMDHATLRNLLKKEDDPNFELCPYPLLNSFFNGLILYYRGPAKDTVAKEQTELIAINIILRKIRIALSYQDTDILKILELAGTSLSKSELSAFFRKQDHKHYKKCGDQWLRHFLHGLALYKNRPSSTETVSIQENVWTRKKK